MTDGFVSHKWRDADRIFTSFFLWWSVNFAIVKGKRKWQLVSHLEAVGNGMFLQEKIWREICPWPTIIINWELNLWSKKILTLALYFLGIHVYRFLFRVHEFSIYWKFLGENEGDKSVDCKDSSRKFTWS